jgi:hypothetical protein
MLLFRAMFDGVFFVPDETGTSVTRLIALVAAPGKAAEQILSELRTVIDPDAIDGVNAHATTRLPVLFEIEDLFNVAIPECHRSRMKCGADILAYVSSSRHEGY